MHACAPRSLAPAAPCGTQGPVWHPPATHRCFQPGHASISQNKASLRVKALPDWGARGSFCSSPTRAHAAGRHGHGARILPAAEPRASLWGAHTSCPTCQAPNTSQTQRVTHPSRHVLRSLPSLLHTNSLKPPAPVGVPPRHPPTAASSRCRGRGGLFLLDRATDSIVSHACPTAR